MSFYETTRCDGCGALAQRPRAWSPPRTFAVSQSRADELRANWNVMSEAWLAKADGFDIEEWYETFLPDHPEWLADAPSSVSTNGGAGNA